MDWVAHVESLAVPVGLEYAHVSQAVFCGILESRGRVGSMTSICTAIAVPLIDHSPAAGGALYPSHANMYLVPIRTHMTAQKVAEFQVCLWATVLYLSLYRCTAVQDRDGIVYGSMR